MDKTNKGNQFNDGELGSENADKPYIETDALEATAQEIKEYSKVNTIVSGADYHDFDVESKFIGHYINEVKREKDGKEENQKVGDIVGYLMVSESGEEKIIGNAHAIEKAFNTVLTEGPDKGKMYKETGATFYIEFLGKTDIGGGRMYNRFKVGTV